MHLEKKIKKLNQFHKSIMIVENIQLAIKYVLLLALFEVMIAFMEAQNCVSTGWFLHYIFLVEMRAFIQCMPLLSVIPDETFGKEGKLICFFVAWISLIGVYTSTGMLSRCLV